MIREEYLKILVENEKNLIKEASVPRFPMQSDNPHWEDIALAKRGFDPNSPSSEDDDYNWNSSEMYDPEDYFEEIGQSPDSMGVPGEDKPWLYGAEKPMEDPLMRREDEAGRELWGHLDDPAPVRTRKPEWTDEELAMLQKNPGHRPRGERGGWPPVGL